MAKCELQAGRLNEEPPVRSSSYRDTSTRAGAAAGPAVSALKVNQARQKKERLSYAIDRLQLQARQKERQLRKSLAAPAVLEDDDF